MNNQFASQKPFVSKETVTVSGKTYPEIVDNHANRGIKLDYVNKQGWGYKDSGFEYDKKADAVRIKGSRYMFGGQILPTFLPWLKDNIGVDPQHEDPAQADMDVDAPIINHSFLAELGTEIISRRSFLKWERIQHSHGCTYQEVFALRGGKFDKVADVVIYPQSTQICEKIVELANKHDVVIVPYGGGTNVTNALKLETSEKRMIVSLDMTRMNSIVWVDKENNLACV